MSMATVGEPSLSSTTSVSPKSWFVAEIMLMMHGLGDVRRPLQESAALVEEIVRDNIVRVLYQAGDVAALRGVRMIGVEELLFIMRKDKLKLKRLLRYLKMKDLKAIALKGATNEEESAGWADAESPPKPSKKRLRICEDYLKSIDQTGEYSNLVDQGNDEVKLERIMRAELLSRKMDQQQYQEYCQARQASFAPMHKMQKFKDWLSMGVTLDIKPNALALEVLTYLAFETVAQVVDLALLVKRDMRMDMGEADHVPVPSINLKLEAAPPVSRTSSATSPPVKSPPSGPSTPSGVPVTHQSDLKSRLKKKKKSQSQMIREFYHSQAIQPAHIREVIRRYTQSIGPFSDFMKSPCERPNKRLLCC